MNPGPTMTADLERQLAEAREHIKKLSRRIHNQRVALRENWEIVEMRASYPRRQALQKRMLECAIEHNRRRREAERQLAEAREGTQPLRCHEEDLING